MGKKQKMTFSSVLFCLKLKNILFIVEEERNHKSFTFKKPESEFIKMIIWSSKQLAIDLMVDNKWIHQIVAALHKIFKLSAFKATFDKAIILVYITNTNIQ